MHMAYASLFGIHKVTFRFRNFENTNEPLNRLLDFECGEFEEEIFCFEDYHMIDYWHGDGEYAYYNGDAERFGDMLICFEEQ